MLQVDVLIIGGGLVGSSLAASLASHPLAKGLSVLVVDPEPPSLDTWGPLSIRTSTVSPSSKRFLEEIGAWECIPEGRIAAFDRMFIWDHPGGLSRLDGAEWPRGTLLFEAGEVSEDVLGFVVDNEGLRGGIARAVDKMRREGKEVKVAKGRVELIEFGEENESNAENIVGGEDIVPWPVVTLEGGERIKCRLIAACDGARSRVRTLAGGDWFCRGYGQSAVVANVRLRDGISTAFQRFVSTGPVAVLPVCWEETAVPMANVIWTTTKVEAEALSAVDDEVFLNELNVVLRANEESGKEDMPVEVLGMERGDKRKDEMFWDILTRGLNEALPRMGIRDMGGVGGSVDIPDCTSVVGKRGMFPLYLGHAPRYVLEEKRTVLVGDAAHSVHPLAGQGVNLGFLDVEVLTDCIASAAGTGRDVGGEMGAPLMRYQRDRMVGNVGMMGVLHSLQKVFGVNDLTGLRDLRRVGMSMVNVASPMKKLILRAMR